MFEETGALVTLDRSSLDPLSWEPVEGALCIFLLLSLTASSWLTHVLRKDSNHMPHLCS